jgi:hypothetical protein
MLYAALRRLRWSFLWSPLAVTICHPSGDSEISAWLTFDSVGGKCNRCFCSDKANYFTSRQLVVYSLFISCLSYSFSLVSPKSSGELRSWQRSTGYVAIRSENRYRVPSHRGHSLSLTENDTLRHCPSAALSDIGISQTSPTYFTCDPEYYSSW